MNRTAIDIAAAVNAGTLSPTEVLQEYLDCIEATEPALHAWVEVGAEAAKAEAAAVKQAPAGSRGLLAGIPVGIKDIFDVAGVRTGLGAPFAAYTPQSDSEAVRRLREAGAVIVGKTETTQFASTDPAPTTNPWNTAHTPGGSSSGSAAAVAAGQVPVALGSQTVGSVLRPAAYCGVVGIKPTHGRISATGVFPFAHSFDHVGIFSRKVTDAALLLNVLAGYDPGDLFAHDVPVSDYLAAARQARQPVVLLPRRFIRTAAGPEVIAHVEAIAEALAAAGATVTEVDIPAEPDDLMGHGRIVQSCEAAAAHKTLFAAFADSYRPYIKASVAAGLETTAPEYVQASSQLRYIRRALTDMLKQGDVMLMASAPTTAPRGLESTGNAVFCAPASFTGLPSISLPSGISPDGLPLAVQLIGSHWQEATLLSSAAWVEQQLGFDASPPL